MVVVVVAANTTVDQADLLSNSIIIVRATDGSQIANAVVDHKWVSVAVEDARSGDMVLNSRVTTSLAGIGKDFVIVGAIRILN